MASKAAHIEPALAPAAKKGVRKSALMLRCSGALLTGLAIVTVITMSLVVMSDVEELPARTASYTIEFPEDEEALNTLSDQLERQAQVDDLANIETAAGEVSQDPGKPAVGITEELPANHAAE